MCELKCGKMCKIIVLITSMTPWIVACTATSIIQGPLTVPDVLADEIAPDKVTLFPSLQSVSRDRQDDLLGI